MGNGVRVARQRSGLTQAELAARAGVSRTLVSAIEAGRHAPSVDAALAIARVLGESVETLFATTPRPPAVIGVDGGALRAGALGRVGRVGDVAVAAPLAARSSLLWPMPDVVADGAGASLLPGARVDGFVVAGCEPALGIAEGLLGSGGPARLVAVPCSTAAALQALAGGRCHAVVVHGRPEDVAADEAAAVDRWHLARWRVGLAHAATARAGLEELVAGEVVLREPGAASQRALVRAVREAGLPPDVDGPVAAGHLDAARIALHARLPAVTYEPAAVRFGLRFLPLETHAVELWVAAAWRDHPGARALVDLLRSASFRTRVRAVGAYDLSGCGDARAGAEVAG